jgi:tRNA (5-methylaminomethyl-2-thiouridylate)-methyltransferase
MAMSGGVDSSVAAALLLEQGYEVIGVTMQIWPDDLPYGIEVEGGCCSLGAVEDARAVANKLGIPYYVLNFQAPFREKVIDYFVTEYIHGRTPNPCIVCNHSLKFSNLLEKSLSLGGEYVATGHYVQKEQDPQNGRWLLRKGADKTKDQSYVLYGLSQEQLAHSLFPLGAFQKTKIREIASNLGLTVADKPDSQEICFVPDQDYGRFIREYSAEAIKPGNFIDLHGKILGRHQGISNFTIGQRKGLGIAAGVPLYVIEIRPDTNEVVLGTDEEVFSKALQASQLNWIAFAQLDSMMEVEVKIRYSAKPVSALVSPLGSTQVKVEFNRPQRAVTPGQAIVFYRGDLMLGGGIIEKSLNL